MFPRNTCAFLRTYRSRARTIKPRFTDRKVDEGGHVCPFNVFPSVLGVHRRDLGSQWNYELGVGSWIFKFRRSLSLCFRNVGHNCSETWWWMQMQKPAAFWLSSSFSLELRNFLDGFWIKLESSFQLLFINTIKFWIKLFYIYIKSSRALNIYNYFILIGVRNMCILYL